MNALAATGQIATTRGYDTGLPLITRPQSNTCPDRISVRSCPNQFKLDPMASCAFVVEQSGGGSVVPQDCIKATIFVIVQNRQPSAVLDSIHSVDPTHFGECVVPIVPEQDITLPSVQAMGADIQQKAFLRSEASTDAFHHIQSDIILKGPRNEPIHRIEIQCPVIVIVEELGPPTPLAISNTSAVADILKGPVPVVLEQ